MNPQATITNYHNIRLQRGATLTIWLNTGTFPELDMVQIEIRVTEHGVIELFCDKDIDFKDFKNWVSID